MFDPPRVLSLAGAWRLRGGSAVRLPGTLDENGVGGPDQEGLSTRLTRLRVYTGPAVYERDAALPCARGERLFLTVERSRELSLCVDGVPVPARSGSLSTPFTFELTAFADGKRHALRLTCDNRYPSGAREAILASSAATDETQTNWNGLLGELALVWEPEVFVDQLRLLDGHVWLTLDAFAAWTGRVRLAGGEWTEVSVPEGRSDLRLDEVIDAPRWDELDGRLFSLTAEIEGMGAWTRVTGARDIACDESGRLTLNGRPIFLRGETNCAVFPETGHEPMDVETWKRVLQTYASYGVNLVRFHSHCPPDAAFTAADELGMLLQPELSQWDPRHALESEESARVYQNELQEIVRALGHHPSFGMLSLGNELHADERGVERMRALVAMARRMDATRLYAWGSNNFYGERGPDPQSDFFSSSACEGRVLRLTSAQMEGPLNEQPPRTDTTFDAAVARARETFRGPILGFEVGQYEILPDFDQLEAFHGVTRAVNYALVRDRAWSRGLEREWKQWVEASGELSLLCYREEVEAALRTRGLSGLCLLGLQDFPGQGTALVGMLDAHLCPKPFPFARPERFAAFFRPVLPLAMLPGRCFACAERPRVGLALANYGRKPLFGPLRWELTDGQTSLQGETPAQAWPVGRVTDAPPIELPLGGWGGAKELSLRLRVEDAENVYSLWVYPDEAVRCPRGVLMTASPREAMAALREGRCVLLEPEPEAFTCSVASCFSTDFWSVGTFPEQSGTMGCLIDTAHPIFRDFPTKPWSTWPWWRMSTGRAMELPWRVKPVARVLDACQTLRSLALLAECRVGPGRLMLSSMRLSGLQAHVEARALLGAILRYMDTDAFAPRGELTPEELGSLFTAE